MKLVFEEPIAKDSGARLLFDQPETPQGFVFTSPVSATLRLLETYNGLNVVGFLKEPVSEFIPNNGSIVIEDIHFDYEPSDEEPPVGGVTPESGAIVPKNLKTSLTKMFIARDRDNKVSVTISLLKENLDLSIFTNGFKLFGLNERGISTDDNPEAIKLGSLPGEIILSLGSLVEYRGKFDTTLVAYGDDYPDGVALWNENFRNASIEATILE